MHHLSSFSSSLSLVKAAIPGSVQVSMSVEGENSDLHLGYKSNMTLKVAFPSGTTPSVTITISASSTKLAMALGDTYMARRGGNIIYLRYGFYYIVLSSTKSVMYIKAYTLNKAYPPLFISWFTKYEVSHYSH